MHVWVLWKRVLWVWAGVNVRGVGRPCNNRGPVHNRPRALEYCTLGLNKIISIGILSAQYLLGPIPYSCRISR